MFGVTDHFVSVQSPDEPHTPSQDDYKRDTRSGHLLHRFSQPLQRWKARSFACDGLGCMGHDSDGMFRTLGAVVVHPEAQEEGQSENFQAGVQKNHRRRGEGESHDCAEREL